MRGVSGGAPGALPLAGGLLLVALVSADPVRISRRSGALRAVSVTLVGVLAAGAIWSTVRLIDDLVHGGTEINSATALLLAGGSVWPSTACRPPPRSPSPNSSPPS